MKEKRKTLNPTHCYADGRRFEAWPSPSASGACEGCAADRDYDLCLVLDNCDPHSRPDGTTIVWKEVQK